MDERIPDEIWIEILKFISLTDRLSVQCVSKRFQALCWDSTLCRTADFSDEIFLNTKGCVNVLRKMKNHLRTLSFSRCHWLSGPVYRQVPLMESLKTLDLTGCHLTAVQLKQILQKCPALQRLALFLDKRLNEGLEKAGWTLKRNITDLSLTIDSDVHSMADITSNIEFATLNTFDQVCFPGHLLISYPQNVMKLFCSWMFHNGSLGRSIDTRHLLRFGIKYKKQNGEIVDQAPDIKFLKMGMLSSTSPPPELKNMNFSRMECLILKLPSVFLSVLQIFISCNLPILRCFVLELSKCRECESYGNFEITIKEFLLASKNLEEICVQGIALNGEYINKLMKSCPKLKSLSFELDSSSEMYRGFAVNAESRSDRGPSRKRIRVSRLAELDPPRYPEISRKITQLEVKGGNSYIGMSISRLELLEVLNLSNLLISDFSFMNTVFKNCTRLRSLTLSSLGVQNATCTYLNYVANGLKHLEKLKELRIQHRIMDVTTLFTGLYQCQSLERLAISAETLYFETPGFLLQSVEHLVHRCPRLHLFAFWNEKLSASLKAKMKKLAQNRRNSRAKLHIEFPVKEVVPSVFIEELVDFESSVVPPNYTASNYPYVN